MAAPNLQTISTCNGKTAPVALANTSETALVTNAASSGKALRVFSITVSNSSTTLAADITVRFYNAASGGTAFAIGPVTVPAYGTVIVIGTENPLYLEEDRRLTVQASASSQLTVLCSYEDIS